MNFKMSKTWIWVVALLVVSSNRILKGEAAATGRPATYEATDDSMTTDSMSTDSGDSQSDTESLEMPVDSGMPLDSGMPMGSEMPSPVDSTTMPMNKAMSTMNDSYPDTQSRSNNESSSSPDDNRLQKLMVEISKVDLKEIFNYDDGGIGAESLDGDIAVTDLMNYVRDIVRWDEITSRELVTMMKDYIEEVLREFLSITDEDTSAIAKAMELALLESLNIMPEFFKEGLYLFSQAVEVTGPDGRSASGHKKLVNPALGVTCPHKMMELIYCWIYDIFDTGAGLTSSYLNFGDFIPTSFIESILREL